MESNPNGRVEKKEFKRRKRKIAAAEPRGRRTKVYFLCIHKHHLIGDFGQNLRDWPPGYIWCVGIIARSPRDIPHRSLRLLHSNMLLVVSCYIFFGTRQVFTPEKFICFPNRKYSVTVRLF